MSSKCSLWDGRYNSLKFFDGSPIFFTFQRVHIVIFNPLDSHVPGNKTFCPLNCHRRQAADLPAKVAKRIGCAHIRGCSLEIGWSRIFGRILGQFLCHLSMQDNLFCPAQGGVTWSFLANSFKRHGWTIPRLAWASKLQQIWLKGAYFILLLEQKGWSKARRWGGGANSVLAWSLFEFVGCRLEKTGFRFRCHSTWMN